ncbi:ferredoxin [Patescibacteria group bacterium]|nr:ferredoxin [Patescibacteria group bacterium]
MIKEIKIDINSCIGCGACKIVAPEIFEINEQGVSQLKRNVKLPLTGNEKKEQVIKAMQNCPVKAITTQEAHCEF